MTLQFSRWRLWLTARALVALGMGVFPASAATFSNTTAISIPTQGVIWPSGTPGEGILVPAAASPFPSSINVTGLSGVVSKLTVTLNSMNHSYPADLDILLVSPDGKQVMLWSDAGGARNLVNVTVTFDDAAGILPEFLPGSIASSYGPWNYYNDDQFPAPAPPMGFGVLDAFSGDIPRLATFNGINPNGVWSLYVVDDADSNGGAISGGWSISVTTVPGAPIVKNVAPSAVTTTSATLNGKVTANGEATTYHFEYGLTTDYGTSTPSTDGGSGTSAVDVSAPITGLTAETTYHARLVATNPTGTTNGPDLTFTTPAVTPAPTDPTAPPPSGSGSGPSPGSTTRTSVTLRVNSLRLRVTERLAVTVGLTSSTAKNIRVVLRAKAEATKPVVVTVPAGRTATALLSLTPSLRKALQQSRRLKANITAAATDGTATETTTVTLVLR